MSNTEHLVAELERLNRLYDALRLVTHSIVHATSQDEVFQATCRLVVECGKFEMSYIALYDGPQNALLTMKLANLAQEQLRS